jgi:hypothetical protein
VTLSRRSNCSLRSGDDEDGGSGDNDGTIVWLRTLLSVAKLIKRLTTVHGPTAKQSASIASITAGPNFLSFILPARHHTEHTLRHYHCAVKCEMTTT